MSKFLCLLAAVVAFNLQAFEIERHTNVVHRNGMTLAQKGGLSDADYVVQDIEPYAFSNGVSSVNGETGAVVITASKIGAVPTTRTINGKGLGANIALTPGDIGAVAVGSVVGSPRTLAKYLHELSFDDSYPDEAQEYYLTRGNGKTSGGCSAVRDGGLMYRNFDYPFDERAEFVIRMSAGVGRFASVGVAQVGTNLTEEIVTSGLPEFSHRYKWLPGATVDGINECGVAVTINVTDDVPSWHSTGSLHPLGVVRWILDHATNALHGAEYVAANVSFPAGWVQNFHYMIADREKTYLVENGEVYDFDDYHESDEPAAMTNFPLNRFPWDGMGMERFGLLLRGNSITNAWYTRAYRRETTPPWVSEFSAAVLARTNEIFNAWASHPREYFRGKTNGGEPWWQTVHTSVYDITNRTLRVAVQEVDDWYVFAVDQANVDLTPIEAQLAALQDGKRDLDDLNVYEKVGVGNDWVWTSDDAELQAHLRANPPNPTYDPDFEAWMDQGYDDGTFYFNGSDPEHGVDAVSIVFGFGKYNEDPEVIFWATATRAHEFRPVTGDSLAKVSQIPTEAEKAAWDAKQDALSAAQLSNIADVQNKRSLTDNTCHKTELGAWVAQDMPSGYSFDSQPFYDAEYGHWIWDSGALPFVAETAGENITESVFSSSDDSFTATRAAVCTDGKKFVTDDVVDGKVSSAVSTNNPAFVSAVRNTPTSGMPEDMPTDWGTYGTVGAALAALAAFVKWAKAKIVAVIGDDGKPTDTFATDLMGNPVAKAKLQTIADEPTIGEGDAVTLLDGSAATVDAADLTSTALNVTFGAARNDGLRLCELYVLNGTADTDLTFDAETVSFVGTGDSFPACEAGINYFVFAEVAANLWKVTRETLKSITTPTPVAAA